MARWKTQFNARPSQGEFNTGVSETVPDQAMTIKELLARYANGMPLTASGRVPVWYGDDHDFPDMSMMDKLEREDTIRRVQAEIKRAQKAHADALRDQRLADQGPNVQRTTGDADDPGTTDQPDNPISEKNRPAGEADTRSPKKPSGVKKH